MKDSFDLEAEDFSDAKKFLSEKDIQSRCVAKAREQGWWARKFSSAPGNTSVPDYIFGKSGLVFFVEFKRPGNVSTERQAKEHELMRAAGLTVHVVDSIERFECLLQ